MFGRGVSWDLWPSETSAVCGKFASSVQEFQSQIQIRLNGIEAVLVLTLMILK